MSTAMTLTSKGQFTFNKGLLEHLGIKVGDQVSIRKMPGGKIEIEAQKSKISAEALFDIFDEDPRADKKFSLEEINAAIAQGYADAGARGLK
jgi:bifunctional DNA-binding transcriptional regulator/antitoxin component of YhaV-PrlF toxin-antitoxin module